MKTILKFLAIFFYSLILAGIFGYWFGKLNELLLVNLFGFRPGFSTFIFTDKLGLFIDGLIVGVPFFTTSFSRLAFQTAKSRLISSLVGGLPTITIVISAKAPELVVSFLIILSGYLFGTLLLITRKKIVYKK